VYFVLLYHYVDDIEARRGAVRPEHLALVQDFHERGLIVMAGAWANPLDGAAIVFHADDRSVVEDFVARDPYAQTGLVTEWQLREWSVVIGAAQS
jgi:uncharacterized protein